MGYEQLMRMPLKTFWMLNNQLERIRSEENLALMPALSCIMGGDGVDKVVEQMKERVGKPSVIEHTKMASTDKKKAAKLFGDKK